MAGSHLPETLERAHRHAAAPSFSDTVLSDRPLNAVVDLRWMRPGLAGGIETLSRSFLGQLMQVDRVNRYTVLVPAELRFDFDTRACPNVRIVAADGPAAWARTLAGALQRRFGRPQTAPLVRSRVRRAEVTLSVPGYVHPDLRSLPNVLIVPDIQHEYRPEFFSARELDERRRLYTASIQHAAHICAISEFTRRTLIERLGVEPERITTTHLAADPIFHPSSPARRDREKVLRRHGLIAGRYVLFPANTWPHKNHETAVLALRRLRDTYGHDPLLVCTGSAKQSHEAVLKLIRETCLADRVRWLGYVPDAEMPPLYEGAAALVFPSLFEGFGLPLLEAMWCDCPIVCGNATSLPEIAGDAALQVDPRSPDELARALHRVLVDAELRRRLIDEGRRRATSFSWLSFTLKVVSALHRARRAR